MVGSAPISSLPAACGWTVGSPVQSLRTRVWFEGRKKQVTSSKGRSDSAVPPWLAGKDSAGSLFRVNGRTRGELCTAPVHSPGLPGDIPLCSSDPDSAGVLVVRCAASTDAPFSREGVSLAVRARGYSSGALPFSVYADDYRLRRQKSQFFEWGGGSFWFLVFSFQFLVLRRMERKFLVFGFQFLVRRRFGGRGGMGVLRDLGERV